MTFLRGVAGVLSPGLLAACATTGSTLGSGVGDSYIERPPYYAGRGSAGASVGVLPVDYQRGASQPEIFDPALSPQMSALLADITSYVVGMGTSLKPMPAAAYGSGLTPPDVMFGCPTGSGSADEDCAEREGEALGRGSRPMRLAVGRPSAAWVVWAEGAMGEAAVDQVLVLTLEIGQRWIRQRGFRGTKEVELGTGYTVRFPWLTSLEGSVFVVQLTGALVGRDGKATRIGAEGLLARRTPMRVSALGVTAVVTDDEIAELRHARRDDLPDSPLVWQEAVRQLVTRLTGAEADR